MHDMTTLLQMLEQERSARQQAENFAEQQAQELAVVRSELFKTRLALEDEATKRRALLSSAADAIISFDADGRIQSANPAAERLFGYPLDDLIGMPIQHLVPTGSDFQPEASRVEKRFAATPSTTRQPLIVGMRRDGSEFELELSASQVYLRGTWHHTWFLRDITQRRILERELSLSQKMESVGRLAAGIAHELNTPIQYIGHNTAFLETAAAITDQLLDLYEALRAECEHHPALADKAQALQARAKSMNLELLRREIPAAIQQSSVGVQRVSQIVTAMKEFSHPGTRDRSYIQLNHAIESTVTISRNEWKYVASVELDLADNLPKLLGYPSDLNQALLNLIVNSAHAIESQHGQGNHGLISISTRSDDECLEVRIQDNGTGIHPDILDKIYDPFFTTKPLGKGTGQGLALVYTTIVDRHGGTVEIDTKVGRGTTFIVRLPVQTDVLTMGDDDHVAAYPVC